MNFKGHLQDIITILIALYGAILSTFVFIKDQRKSRRSLNLKINHGYLDHDANLRQHIILFDISNPGHKPITVNNPHLILPNRKNFYLPKIESKFSFPTTIEEGQSIQAWVELNILKLELINLGFTGEIILKGCITDQTGKRFKAKNFVTANLSYIEKVSTIDIEPSTDNAGDLRWQPFTKPANDSDK